MVVQATELNSLKTMKPFWWQGGNRGTHNWYMPKCQTHNNTAGGVPFVLEEQPTFSTDRYAPSRVLLKLMWCYRQEKDS